MGTPRTAAFYTLGCKLNFSETSTLAKSFEKRGYGVIDFNEVADVYVINTCSVTEFADRKCRNIVRQVLKKAPASKIVVTGCYAQLKPLEILKIKGVDLVLGAAEKFRMLDFIEAIDNAPEKGMMAVGDVKEADTFISSFSIGDRTRSFLKVQDGCNYKCTFCTIPLARGASRSDTIEQVLKNAQLIGQSGVQEIVLTGINLGDFGNGTEIIEGKQQKKNEIFIDLLKALDTSENVPRIRISSIEPNLLSSEIIELVAKSTKIMPHFHIPLQSGSDEILGHMKRRYQTELFKNKIEQIKAFMPHCCIGVDVIVGFPGETTFHFEQTFDFLNSLDISYLHVFTYSERANTPASSLPDNIPMHIRKKRNEILTELSIQKKSTFYFNHEHSTRPALIEKGSSEQFLEGYTDNYIKIKIPFDASKINKIVNLKLNFEHHN